METQPKKQINYWFVEAGDKCFEDRKRLSLADKKIWLCNNDYYGDLVKSMQPGDKIALKSHFFRNNDLPFNNKGQDVPVMSIEAIGVVVKNYNDGKKISVVWNKFESPREWYFYTSQAIIFSIQKGMWMADNLLAFTFEQHSQDIQRFLSTPYWQDRLNDTQPYFFWSRICESLAKRLIEFRHKRDKFIPLLHLLFNQIDPSGVLLTHQQLISAYDMDPFAIMELCFRALVSKKVSGNIDELVSFFAIDPICLNAKQSIPFINPDQQCHFSWTLVPDELRINILWKLFDAALHYTDNQDLQARSTFIDVFEQARQFYSLANITLALSWIKPWTFLNLNEEVIRNAPKDIAEFIRNNGMYYSQDVRHYLELIETLDYRFLCGNFSINSFPALLQHVFQTKTTILPEFLARDTQRSTFGLESNNGSTINQTSTEKVNASNFDDTDITLDFHLTKFSNEDLVKGVKESTKYTKRINNLAEKESKLDLNQSTLLDKTADAETFQTETIPPLLFDSDIYQSMEFEFGINSDNSQSENTKSISFDSVMHYPTMLDYEVEAETNINQSEKIKPLSFDSAVHHPTMLDYEMEVGADIIQPEETKLYSVDSAVHHPTMLDYEMEVEADISQSREVKPLLFDSEVYHQSTMLDDGTDVETDTTQTMSVKPLISNFNAYNSTRVDNSGDNNVSIEASSIQAEILSSLSQDLDYIKPTLQAEETNKISSEIISPFPSESNERETVFQVKETEADILLTGITSPLPVELADTEPPLQTKEIQVDAIPSETSSLSFINSKLQLQTGETEADILLTGITSPLPVELADTEPPLQAKEVQVDAISSETSSLSFIKSKPQLQAEETEADILLTGIISPLPVELADAEPPLQAKEDQIDVISSETSSLSFINSKPQLRAEETEADILLTGIISPLPVELADAEPPLQAKEDQIDVILSETSPLSLEDSKLKSQVEETEADILLTGIISPLPVELADAEPPLQTKKDQIDVISSETSSLSLEDSKLKSQVEETEADILLTGIISPISIELADVDVETSLQAKKIQVDVISSEASSLSPEDSKPKTQVEETEADILLTGVTPPFLMESAEAELPLQVEETQTIGVLSEELSASPIDSAEAELPLQVEETQAIRVPLEELSPPIEPAEAEIPLQVEETQAIGVPSEELSASSIDSGEAALPLQVEETQAVEVTQEELYPSSIEPAEAELPLQVEETPAAKVTLEELSPSSIEPAEAEIPLQVEETQAIGVPSEELSASSIELVEAELPLQVEETQAVEVTQEELSPSSIEPAEAEIPLQVEEIQAIGVSLEELSASSIELVEAELPLQVEETQAAEVTQEELSASPIEPAETKLPLQLEETQAIRVPLEELSPPPIEPAEAEIPLQIEETQAIGVPSEELSASSIDSGEAALPLQVEETQAVEVTQEELSPSSIEPAEAELPLQVEETQAIGVPSEEISASPIEPAEAELPLQVEETQAAEATQEELSASPIDSGEAELPLQVEETQAVEVTQEELSPSSIEPAEAELPLQVEETQAAEATQEELSASSIDSGEVELPLQVEEIQAIGVSLEEPSASPIDSAEAEIPLQEEETQAAEVTQEELSPSPIEPAEAALSLQVEETQADIIPTNLLLPLQINNDDNKSVLRSKEIAADILQAETGLSLSSNLNTDSPVKPINENSFNAPVENKQPTVNPNISPTTLSGKMELIEKPSILNNILDQEQTDTLTKENSQHLLKRRSKATGIIHSVKQALAALSIYHTDEQTTKTSKIDNDINQLLINEKFINSDSIAAKFSNNLQEIAMKTDNSEALSTQNNVSNSNKATVLDLLANYKEKSTTENLSSHHPSVGAIVEARLHAIEADTLLSQTIIAEKTALNESQVETVIQSSSDGNESKSDTSKTSNNNPAPSTESHIYTLLNDCFFDELLLHDIISCLKDKHNLVLQGPGGTGKSWLARRLAFVLTECKYPHNIYTLQSHSNLSYERFIGQLYIDNQGNQKIKEGIFLSLIKSAQRQPERAHVLIIEDIHRLNPTEIFGDLFSLLDINQRSEDNAIIFYSSENGKDNNRIIIPNNVYIIATMNIIPSCLHAMGYEWRRPFAFVSLEPQINERWRNWLITHCNVNPSLAMDIQHRLLELNQMIAADSHLGRHCCIGHSYVTPNKPLETDDTRSWFKRIVEMEIAPLLDLYWSDRPEYALQAKKRLLEGW